MLIASKSNECTEGNATVCNNRLTNKHFCELDSFDDRYLDFG